MIKRIGKFWTVIIALFIFMALMMILTGVCTPFADFYVGRVYPVIMNISAIPSLFPISLGEIVIIALVALLIIGIIAFAPLMIILKKKRRIVLKIYARTISAVTVAIMLPVTLNCLMMYKASSFSEKYFADAKPDEEISVEVYRLLADKLNELESQVSRDEHGYFVLTDDLHENAKQALSDISGDYGQLKGFYPNPKPITNSFWLSQEGLTGIFLPFTLEANYNRDMCDINKPFTVCHELAHLKGVISEDEANFISFIACINSESADFQYCGYLSAMEYFLSYTNVSEVCYDVMIDDFVWRDMFRFLPETYWEENEEKEIIPTEVVETVADVANDTYLKVNGEEDGVETYSQMVDLILEYYSVNPIE